MASNRSRSEAPAARRAGSRAGAAAIAATILAALVVAASPAGAAQRPPPAPNETVAPADLLGSDLGFHADRRGKAPVDSSGGFIYRNGMYAPLDGLSGLPTAHLGTNNRGQIVGGTLDGATLHGFLRNQRGDYTSFDAAPDAVGTLPFDINDRGTAVGLYADAQLGIHGFLRQPNGVVTPVDVPGAQSTVASGINGRGAVVGSFVDGKGGAHGFLLDRGRVTPIDPPDASPAGNQDPLDGNVWAFDINDRGQIVGFYPDARGTFHGFLYDKGRFTTIDPPDASDAGRTGGGCDGIGFAATAAFGINNRGQVVGQYVDDDGLLHGYLWERRRGFRTIDPPRGAGTVAVDANDRGQILLPAPGGFAKGDGCF
jgi:probable HAF family extracellular repeat protein